MVKVELKMVGKINSDGFQKVLLSNGKNHIQMLVAEKLGKKLKDWIEKVERKENE